MTKYWMWRVAAAVVPRIPVALARPLFIAVGMLAWALAGETRRRAERNLRHVPSLAANTARLQAAVRGVFITSALNYLDFLRGRSLTDEEIHSGWTVEDEHLLYDAAAEGRGVVILSGHFGNFEFAASRLAHRAQMVTPAERMRPERLFDLFCALRNHHNLRVVPGDSRESLREMADTLKAGGFLLILADRHILGTGAQVDFFGEPATLATGPMALAVRTGAPIICAFSWRTGPGRAHGVFYRLTWNESAAEITPKATSATRARIRDGDTTLKALRAFVALLERMIAAHPEAWVSALAPVWEAQAPARAASPERAATFEQAQPNAQPTGARGTSVRGIDMAKSSSIE
jgi:lauroyl/myristoyl acyltransferase